MTANLHSIRNQLVTIRDQLLGRQARLRRDVNHADAPLAADSADRAQERENDEVLAELIEATGELAAEYDRALQRLDAGLYGTCESCGFAIEPKRLEAVPQATTCSSCAAAVMRAA